MKEEKRQGRYGPSSRSTDKDCETSKAAGVLPGIAGIHGDFDNKRIISFYNFPLDNCPLFAYDEYYNLIR